MILLNLPRPPSTNNLFRTLSGKGRVRTTRYKTWIRAAGNELIAQRQRHMAGPVRLHIQFGRDKRADGSPSTRKLDIDNYAKGTLDLLTKHHLIDDDAFVEELYLRWTDDVSSKRMMVTVVEAMNAEDAA